MKRFLKPKLIFILVVAAMVFGTAITLTMKVPARAAGTDCSPNGIALSGSSWLGGGGVNVCNHPGNDSANYINNINGVRTLSGYKWECVELVNRLYLTKGWTTATWYGNGNTLVYHIPAGLTKQDNGSISYVNPGDVITLNYGANGHAGIIDKIDSNGTIHIINQNATLNSSAYIDSGSLSTGNAHYHMNAWKGYSVQAIVHHPGTHSDTIIKVQKTIEPDGTQQLYTATSSDVWQTWWNSNSGTTPLIYISQNNIADIVEFDAGGGVQELFTATSTGVWETNWGNGQSPSSSNIIPKLSGVKKILFHSEVDSGLTTYQIYLMTNTGVYQYWWNANSNGIQSATIYSVSNPIAIAFGTSPSGVDEIFTATAGAVEESSFAGGGITNTQIIRISQNNITAIDKLNSSGGTEILSTSTTTGDWDSYWTTGSPTYTQVVNNFNGAIAVKRRFDPGGTNQLYLANGGVVEQYWWNSSGSGAASLITISQNNISTIDEDQNGSYEQLYTGAGHIVYETYWGPTNGTGQIINTDTQIANGNVL